MMSYRRLARTVYLALFVGVYYWTDIFADFPPLLWIGTVGLIVVFFDAMICARRRWRVLRSEMKGEDGESDPTC
jgi:hypothetical protein